MPELCRPVSAQWHISSEYASILMPLYLPIMTVWYSHQCVSLLKLRQSTKTSVSQAMVVAVLYSPFKTGILWQITLMPASWDYLRSLIYTCDLQLGGSRDTQPWFRKVFCCVIVFLAILCLNEPWFPVPHMSLLLFLVTCTYIPEVKVYIKPFLYHLASFIGVAL